MGAQRPELRGPHRLRGRSRLRAVRFATGDHGFAAEQAWPVVARRWPDWVQSRATWTERGVEILRAMGVAERSEPFDNDAFTNIAAATVLRDAVAIANQVGSHGPRAVGLDGRSHRARRPTTV